MAYLTGNSYRYFQGWGALRRVWIFSAGKIPGSWELSKGAHVLPSFLQDALLESL